MSSRGKKRVWLSKTNSVLEWTFSVSTISNDYDLWKQGLKQFLLVLFFRAFITSNVDICRSDSWYCLDNSFHDYDHFILCQNASLLLSFGFFKQTQTVRYWKVRFFKRTKKGWNVYAGCLKLIKWCGIFKKLLEAWL